MIRHLQLPAATDSVERACGSVAQALPNSVSMKALADIALLTSELVSVSVHRAGLDPKQRVGLHIEATPSLLRIEVIDPGSGFTDGNQHASTDSGWGLFLVEQLSDRHGHQDPGSVWFEVDL